MASKNLSLNNIGTLKFVVRILTTYLIIIMMIPSLQAVLPFKLTLHKRQTGSSCTVHLGTNMVHTARHCGQRCAQTYNCKAFNVIRVQQEAPGLQCETFSHSDPDHLVDDGNAVFWELNYCHGHVCKNGGGCRIENEGYKCDCADGYTGRYCETEINECESVPCENGGTCTDAVAAYTCHCAEGYVGTHCETEIDECASDPCKNAGVCTDVVAGFTCACAPGWQGITCQTNINECASSPCRNGGTCRDEVNRYSCVCRAGYAGNHCQTNINECASNPCINSGTCIDGVARYTCACRQGYEGTRCQTNINECGSNPCYNGGTCTDGVARYTCGCKAGYEGTRCQTNKCEAKNCLNGATCVPDENDNAKCICDPNTQWTGARCGYHANACTGGATLTAPSGVVHSHLTYDFVAEKYGDYLDCSWNFQVAEGMAVRLIFNKFALEGGDQCTFDTVRIYDGSGSSTPLLGKYCGIDVVPGVSISTGREMFVTFTTDYSYALLGFEFVWESVPQ